MNGGYAVNKSILSFLAILVLILFSTPVRAASCSISGSWSAFIYNFPVGSYSVSASDLPGTSIFSTGLVNSGWGSGSLNCASAQRYWEPKGLTLSSIGMTQVYDTNLQGVGVYIRIIRGDGNNVALPFNERFLGPVVIGPNGPRIQVDLIKTADVVEAGLINMGLIYQEDARDIFNPNPTVMTAINLNNVKIVASACSLNNGSPLVVPLGTHSVTAFTGVGSTTGKRNINLNLTGCPALTATIKFMGDSQTGATNLLRLTSGSAPESHIAIALFENDGTPLPINTASSTTHLLDAGNNTITYKAAYQQHTDGAVPTGAAPGTATLDIQYN